MPDLPNPILHVVLYAPEIPQNSGNIGRSCVAVGAKLWLVKPLGYSLDDRYLKRAGMDYWQFLDYEVVDDWDSLITKIPQQDQQRFWLFTKFATKLVWEAEFEKGDVLVFGSESKGLPDAIKDQHTDHCLKLPMHPEVRSLNLASCANTIMYEAVRQFGGL